MFKGNSFNEWYTRLPSYLQYKDVDSVVERTLPTTEPEYTPCIDELYTQSLDAFRDEMKEKPTRLKEVEDHYFQKVYSKLYISSAWFCHTSLSTSGDMSNTDVVIISENIFMEEVLLSWSLSCTSTLRRLAKVEMQVYIYVHCVDV